MADWNQALLSPVLCLTLGQFLLLHLYKPNKLTGPLKTTQVVILNVAPAPSASSPGSLLRKYIHGHTGPTQWGLWKWTRNLF